MAKLWVRFSIFYSGEYVPFFYFGVQSAFLCVTEVYMVLILNLSLSHCSKVLGKTQPFSVSYSFIRKTVKLWLSAFNLTI